MKREKAHYEISPRLSLIPQKPAIFQNTEQIKIKQDSQQQLYHKIKSFIVRNNRKSQKKYSMQKLQRPQNKSHRILVHSQQEKQLMSLGSGLLPILIASPSNNQNSKKKREKYKSQLDNILSNREKFIKTYFKEIKQHKKNVVVDDDQISYIFPQVSVGDWKINGYLKGKHILVKGVNKKNRTLLKKYQYSQVYKKIRKNYQNWVRDIFIFETQVRF